MSDVFNSTPPGEPVNPSDALWWSRRAFLWSGLVFVAGCATSNATRELPGPVWTTKGIDLPGPFATRPPHGAAAPGGVMPRSRWAGGAPVTSLMQRLARPRYITVHHDGMSVFRAVDEQSAVARLELIRTAHRNKSWGDIGYHFAIDPAGRVWEGRPLAFQGAHVKDYNEHNIGIVCLGNFDAQSLPATQTAALNRHVTLLMRQHGVSITNVRTHQEWPSNTACPGRSLQRHMVDARRRGLVG